jgi:hypothetical protein
MASVRGGVERKEERVSFKSKSHAAASRWRAPAKIFSILVLVSLLLAGQTPAPARASGATLYVKSIASGTKNCDSWVNGCGLQKALSLAAATDQIWVSQGTYKPHATDESVSFVLMTGVSIYGGFTTSMSLLSQRNPGLYVTTLSGDINAGGVVDDNSWHVVKGGGADTTAVLDGFTITGGYAVDADTSDEQSGGGVYNNAGSSPTLRNLWITGNSARFSGGMENDSSSPGPTLENVTFSGNTAVYATSPAPSSGGSGGAIGNFNSNPVLTNVTISGNTASVSAGGMNNSVSNPTLRNVTFSGNTAASAGAMYNGSSSPIIYDSIFYGDSSEISGTSAATIIDSIVGGGGACPIPGTCINLVAGNPLLGPLANNGGWTQTRLLQVGSAAINAGGVNSACPPPATDQRGVPRPWDAACDLGAVEFATVSISGNAGAPSVSLSYTDGTPKTAYSGGGGLYSFAVPYNWSGTVTPSLSGFTFSPTHITYSPLTTNQINQDYTATVIPPLAYPADLATVCLRPAVGVQLPVTGLDVSPRTLVLNFVDVTSAAIKWEVLSNPMHEFIMYSPTVDLPLGLNLVSFSFAKNGVPSTLVWSFTVVNIACGG